MKKQRNLRKSRALHEQEGLSDDEEEQRVALDDMRALQQTRKRKAGLGSDVLIAGDTRGAGGSDGEEEFVAGDHDAGALAGTYTKETLEDEDVEDPHMKAYVEEQLAKRLGRPPQEGQALVVGGPQAGGGGGGEPPLEGDMQLPESLRAKGDGADEPAMAGTFVGPSAGISEMPLPLEYKLRNIEETEAAKKALLDRRGRGSGGQGDAAAEQALRRTMLPLEFGTHKLIRTGLDDGSFVARRMREDQKEASRKGKRR